MPLRTDEPNATEFVLRGRAMTFALLAASFLLGTPSLPASQPRYISSAELDRLSQAARRNQNACGPLAVHRALARMGRVEDPQKIIAMAKPGEMGTTIGQLLQITQNVGVPGKGIKTHRENLTLLPVPSILIVDDGSHCVVYEGIDQPTGAAKIFEPEANQEQTLPLERVKRAWTGEAIVFDAPSPSLKAFWSLCVLIALAILTPCAYFAFRVLPTASGAATAPAALSRRAISLIEVLVAIAIVGILMALLLPVIQATRESSRRSHCLNNLHQLGVALQRYHDSKRSLPPAVIWKPAGEPLGMRIAAPGSIDRISLGLAPGQEPDRVFANWVICILPYLEQQELFDAFDLNSPVGAARNESPRASELPLMKCPSDAANEADNHFQRSGAMAPDKGYARGNYAINAGPDRRCLTRLSARNIDCPDGFSVDGTDLQVDTNEVWGSGVAGVNRSMRYGEFTSGLNKTVALEEVRSGLTPLDRRGVWALGFAGSSITACHGQWGNGGSNVKPDAIQGCTAVSMQVPDLEAQGMACIVVMSNPQYEISEMATARSRHPGGVHLMMADASAHFVSDAIDGTVWHNMHMRNNPAPSDSPF